MDLDSPDPGRQNTKRIYNENNISIWFFDGDFLGDSVVFGFL